MIKNDLAARNMLKLVLSSNFYGKALKPHINGIGTDIKFGTFYKNFMACYSILNNQWLAKPLPLNISSLTSQVLIREHYKKLKNIYKSLVKIKLEENQFNEKNCQEISQIYKDATFAPLRMNAQDKKQVTDFLSYKMLVARGEISKLRDISIGAVCNAICGDYTGESYNIDEQVNAFMCALPKDENDLLSPPEWLKAKNLHKILCNNLKVANWQKSIGEVRLSRYLSLCEKEYSNGRRMA